MASTPRVVFWANRDEWTEIYQCLFSFDDANLQRKGVDRVMAWKSRSGGKLPLSIECTLDLILAHLADDTQTSTQEAQLILSMALVRFVNSMVDLNQKGIYARSVQSIAEEIGLPDWMVDLRHEATHANLPSHHTLRAGVHAALSWLREEYWEAQNKMHKDSEDKLGVMIGGYKALYAKKKKKKRNIDKREQKVKAVAKEIGDFVSCNNLWSHLQGLLLKDGLRTEDQDEEPNSAMEEQTATSSSQLSDEEIKNWKPLFVALDKESPDFLPFFLVSILDPQFVDLENGSSKNHLMGWVLWVLQSSSTFTAKFPWLTLLEICLKNPNPFVREFVTLILNEMPSVTDTLKHNILSLININLVENPSEKKAEEAYECKSLEQILNNSGSKCATQTVQENGVGLSSGWSKSGGETKWNLIPFGEVLGCDQQSLNLLELPEFFIKQNQMNNENSTACKNVEVDVDFTEEDTEMINEYDESDVPERLLSEDDVSIMDEKVNGVSNSLNNNELEGEICLF